jgi:hypothetical protein
VNERKTGGVGEGHGRSRSLMQDVPIYTADFELSKKGHEELLDDF